MNINVYPIVSKLHNNDVITNETKQLLNDIEQQSDFRFHVSPVDQLYDTHLSLILVQSGGSEGQFLQLEKHFKPPYYLLTYGNNNSLAASMEILSYLRNKDEQAEILHGSPNSITLRLRDLSNPKQTPPVRLGVIGEPSDWLIASNVDYGVCKQRLNVELVDISIQELIDTYHRIDLDTYQKELELQFDQNEIKDAKKLSKALEIIQEKYHLEGLTLRCFDLLDTVKTTGCLGLALLNDNDSIGTCEGDIPAMLSMYILKKVIGEPGFQANPSRIDTTNNDIVFAHCTVSLKMTESYKVMTHYESGIGVAFRGHLKTQPITIFKLSNNLKDYYVEEGQIIENLNEENLCRTQIKVHLKDTTYFLTNPYGNHHIIVYGHHKDTIDNYMLTQSN